MLVERTVHLEGVARVVQIHSRINPPTWLGPHFPEDAKYDSLTVSIFLPYANRWASPKEIEAVLRGGVQP